MININTRRLNKNKQLVRALEPGISLKKLDDSESDGQNGKQSLRSGSVIIRNLIISSSEKNIYFKREN